MASYRGHLLFGAATAAVGAASVIAFTEVKELEAATIIFLLIVIGAFLPDIDSDSSLPFYLTFGAFTFAVLTAVVYGMLLSTDDARFLISVPVAAFLLLWFGVGRIVKSITRHRGMVHSIPACAIAILATVVGATLLNSDPVRALFFGLAIGAGFLSHLILDEIVAVVDGEGLPLVPNKAFGSALKLWSPSAFASLFSYVLVLILFYLTGPTIAQALAAGIFSL